MPSIQFETADGEVIVADKEIASCFGNIASLNIGTREIKINIKQKGVSSATMRKVIEWVTHHKNDPQPADAVLSGNNEKLTGDISTWDAEFLNVDPGRLFELALAASNLEIQGLLDLIYNRMETFVKGKTPEEVRRLLGIPHDKLPGFVEDVVSIVNRKMRKNK